MSLEFTKGARASRHDAGEHIRRAVARHLEAVLGDRVSACRVLCYCCCVKIRGSDVGLRGAESDSQISIARAAKPLNHAELATDAHSRKAAKHRQDGVRDLSIPPSLSKNKRRRKGISVRARSANTINITFPTNGEEIHFGEEKSAWQPNSTIGIINVFLSPGLAAQYALMHHT
jgi:hypothetical protein